MRRLPHSGLLVLLALLLLLSGCSVQPADGTYLLPSEPSSSDSKGTFDLKEVKVQSVDGKRPIGWRGNDLVLYDSAGIYQFNYSTASMTPLLAISDKYLSFAALSGDGKKIAYSEMDRQKKPISLYVADSDCQTNRVNLSDTEGIAWLSFAWSSEGNYLYSPSAGNKKAPVFDVPRNTPITPKFKTSPLTMFYDDLDEASGKLLLSQFNDSTLTVYTATFDAIGEPVQTFKLDSKVSQISFAGNDHIAFLSDSTLTLMHLGQTDQKQTVSNVVRYGISADKAYICLVKTNAWGTSDVYVGNLQDGNIVNQTLIYRGLDSTAGNVFLAPDDRKVAVYEFPAKKPLAKDFTVMVLTFR